jgi:hypothetical protein
VLAVRFGVSTGAACGWLGIARREGRRDLRAHDGGRCLLGGATPEVLAGLVAEQTDATLARLGLPPHSATDIILSHIADPSGCNLR